MKTINPTQQLRDPNIEPTEIVLSGILKSAYPSYCIFLEEIKSRGIETSWRYYTDGKAWLAKGVIKWKGRRAGLKSKTLFWLSVWDEYYKVNVYIPETQRNDLLNLNLEDDLKEKIQSIKRMGETYRILTLSFDLYHHKQLASLLIIIDYCRSNKSLNI